MQKKKKKRKKASKHSLADPADEGSGAVVTIRNNYSPKNAKFPSKLQLVSLKCEFSIKIDWFLLGVCHT